MRRRWIALAVVGALLVGYSLAQEAAGPGGTTDLPTPNAIGTIAMVRDNRHGRVAQVGQ